MKCLPGNLLCTGYNLASLSIKYLQTSHPGANSFNCKVKENEGEIIFCLPDSIEGEYVPMEGDEVTYKVCPVPPKNQKFQAVDVVITHLNPGTKHETWSGQIISS